MVFDVVFIVYPDMVTLHLSHSPSDQGLRWDCPLRTCPICKEAGSSSSSLLPFLPLKEEKEAKGKILSLLRASASESFSLAQQGVQRLWAHAFSGGKVP